MLGRIIVFGRGIVYCLTMLGVLFVVGIVFSIILSVANVQIGNGGIITILIFSAIMGFAGSLISLFLSKIIVKKSMNVQVITTPSNKAESWLVNTIELLASKKGVKMPEVGIYSASEMNAFATGWNRNSALVAVSSGLLDNMEQDEIEAVLGHEMSHVANGDMVTQTLVQGIVNTFVYALSFIIANIITNALKGNKEVNRMTYYLINSVLQMLFGICGTIVVMWFSRWREYHADAGSADVLGKDAMIKALNALKSQHVDKKPENVKTLCIAGIDGFSELFMTHPPLDKRIAALKRRAR
jgi:heat shock protein HtpX